MDLFWIIPASASWLYMFINKRVYTFPSRTDLFRVFPSTFLVISLIKGSRTKLDNDYFRAKKVAIHSNIDSFLFLNRQKIWYSLADSITLYINTVLNYNSMIAFWTLNDWLFCQEFMNSLQNIEWYHLYYLVLKNSRCYFVESIKCWSVDGILVPTVQH